MNASKRESGPLAPPSTQKSSNFYLGFLFLSKRRREALEAVYAFARHVDDIVDSGALAEPEARKELDFWRKEITRLMGGEPTHPIAKRLHPFVEEFGLPEEGFRALLEGMEMDLDKKRYGTFADLEKYLFGAAGSVGLLCVEIFGHRHTPPEDLRRYAIGMGNALQLTNILRDVGADLERGRIYLPIEDIRKAGYSQKDLVARDHTPAFERLMALEYERAKGFYREARDCLHAKDRAAMLPAEVMAHVYEDILEKIRAGGYRVFFHRYRLSVWRKVWLALKAWAAA
ncbi:MAG: presqualene diphosphate synthase HpnD [Elusimicrobiota bacterium]